MDIMSIGLRTSSSGVEIGRWSAGYVMLLKDNGSA